MVSHFFWPNWFPIIKKSNNIWTSISAISCPNTSIINLNIHAFIIVISCVYGAYRFTGSISTVLTRNWYESCLNIGKFTFPISFNSHPRHNSSSFKFILIIKRYIIFNLTSNNTSIATSTFVCVYYHPPTSIFVFYNHILSLKLMFFTRISIVIIFTLLNQV